MLHLFFDAKAIRQFGYRQAWPDKIILTYNVDPHNDEQVANYSRLREKLCKQLSVYPDNHTAYEVKTEGSDTSVFLFFSDWKIYVTLGFINQQK